MTPPGVMKWGESFEPVTPGQIRGGRIKIKSPAGQKCMSHGQLFCPAGDYFSPRAKICVPRAIILARGRLFWPAGKR